MLYFSYADEYSTSWTTTGRERKALHCFQEDNIYFSSLSKGLILFSDFLVDFIFFFFSFLLIYLFIHLFCEWIFLYVFLCRRKNKERKMSNLTSNKNYINYLLLGCRWGIRYLHYPTHKLFKQFSFWKKKNHTPMLLLQFFCFRKWMVDDKKILKHYNTKSRDLLI